jgi:hypothetical protein
MLGGDVTRIEGRGGRALKKKRRTIIRNVLWYMECSYIPIDYL